MSKKFIFLSHTADIKLRGMASVREKLFENMMLGMFEIMMPYKKDPVELCQQKIEIISCDIESLLVDFLSQLLTCCLIYKQAYHSCVFKLLTNTHLVVTVSGYAVTKFSGVEIKAVTYHDVYIAHDNTQWIAEIVFDI